MARLRIQSPGFDNQVIELKLGPNRFGRSDANDFQLEHPTISGVHCEVLLQEDRVTIRDCASRNGTFLDGKRVKEGLLKPGQTLRLGSVELLVESTDVIIAIPKFEVPRPAPPVVLADGSLVCPRHKDALAVYQCTHCREVLCVVCVHRLRRRGGKLLKLCPLCSHPCAPIGPEAKKRKSLLKILQETVKRPFNRNPLK
jgi:hypothetical protein